MGIQVGDNFDHKSKKPLDNRTQYSTLASMKAVTDANINEGCLAYCVETDKYYKFLSTNTVDETTGKWREFSSGSSGTSDYSDLTNKPSIENVTLSGNKSASDLGLAKTSDLTGFITKSVDDLVNYYLKSETYTKTEVDTIASNIKNSRFEIVSSLPTENIKTNVIYLVPRSTTQTSNTKDEYINLDGTTAGWELIGTTDIDLSGYVTTQALNTALADYTTTANLTTLLNAKQDILQYSSMPTASVDYLGKVVQFIGATAGGYTHNYFYECVSDGESTPTYSWQATEVQAGGSGGTSDYTDLENKPSINNVTLSGNKTSSQLGLQGQVQFSTMPTASSTNLGSIVQFIGTTSGSYTNGHFYKCVSDGQSTPTYSWEEVDVNKTIEKALTPQTLSVGNTSLTFQDSSIVAGCTIIPYTNKYGVVPTDITVTSGQAVLTFDAQETAISVYIGVR